MHQNDDHPRTRHDDYRPEALKRFWESAQDALYGLGWGIRNVFDIAIPVVLCVALVALLVLSGLVFYNLLHG